MAKTLGQRIRELREHQDMSLREFAGRIGVSAAHESDIELGRRFPSDELLRKIAIQLGQEFIELKRLDVRTPVDDLKKLVEDNPAFGMAFRKIVDKRITPEEIIKMANARPDRAKKK